MDFICIFGFPFCLYTFVFYLFLPLTPDARCLTPVVLLQNAANINMLLEGFEGVIQWSLSLCALYNGQ
jgi:hypothetical protein